MFDSIEENGFDKLGEEGIDKGGRCCVVENGFESKGSIGSLAKHDIVKISFGVGETEA